MAPKKTDPLLDEGMQIVVVVVEGIKKGRGNLHQSPVKKARGEFSLQGFFSPHSEHLPTSLVKRERERRKTPATSTQDPGHKLAKPSWMCRLFGSHVSDLMREHHTHTEKETLMWRSYPYYTHARAAINRNLSPSLT